MGKFILTGPAALIFFTAVAGAEPHTGASEPVPTTMMAGTEDEGLQIKQGLSDEALQRAGAFTGERQEIKRDVVLIKDDTVSVKQRHTANLPVGKRGAKVPVETVEVDGGRVDALIPEGPGQGLLLQSKSQVQAISVSGRLAMIVGKSSVTVAALSGDALVGQKGRFKHLPEGKIRHFNLRTGTVSEQAFLSAPQAQPPALGIALSGGSELPIKTSAVPGASKYRAILLSDDGSQSGEVLEETDPNQLVAQTPHAGTFWVVVRAVDEFGFQGAPSAPVSAQVLGLKNSEDVVRHGMIFLSPGESAQIVGQKGLVMRYGTSPEFIPAPASIGLPARKATTVEFRDPSDPNKFAVFKLAPRLLKTRIEIGPASSIWPRDNIDISVRMWDGHGHPLSWMDEYRPIVKVGVDEVPVEWNRGDGRLTTVLPPQSGPGPWVVRVSIVSANGQEIGRNFLEIIPPPPKKKRVASAK